MAADFHKAAAPSSFNVVAAAEAADSKLCPYPEAPVLRSLRVNENKIGPAIHSEMLKAGVIDTIQKPYDFNDLLAKTRSVIGPDEVADDHPELF